MAKDKVPAGFKELPPAVPPEGGAPLPAREEKLPKFGTARPAEHGTVPRVCDQLERAPAGLKRFKIRCNNYTPQRTRYILADNEEQARDCYLKTQQLDHHVGKLVDGKVEAPALVVTTLKD